MSRLLFAALLFYTCFAGAQSLPAVGLGLAANQYYLGYHMFTDAMKSCRWINVNTWDSNGFPTSAATGQFATARIGIANGAGLTNGQYILTWEGNGEVQFYDLNTNSFSLASEDLTGNPKRRVYNVATTNNGIGVRILSFPATNIKLWIPGQENAASLWNPEFVCYMDGLQGGVLRMMDIGRTNYSEQAVWNNRTPRAWSTYANTNQTNSVGYTVNGGVAYEAMIELANEMNSDLWICMPHMADDTYVSHLAHLVSTGIDLATGQQTTAPLNANLRVWVEYSNEVWNWNFWQSSWVLNNLPGNNLDEQYALRARDIFQVFRNSFGNSNRVVRVLATHTASPSRAQRRIAALTSADWDVLAITTYFQYDYEEFIYQNWNSGTLTHQAFHNYISNRMGTGAYTYPDPEGFNGAVALNYYYAGQAGKPVVSYEGNEHFNTSRRVDTNGDGSPDTYLYDAAPGVVTWLHDFCRSTYMYDLLEQCQLRHEASGMQTHVAFVGVQAWSANGQWGFAEHLGQDLSEAAKYRWLHDHYGLPYPVGGGAGCLTAPSALPVTWLSFTGKEIDGQVQLRWQTAQEHNNAGFTVQHATDGQAWETLGFVPAQAPEAATHHYTYTHDKPVVGPNYYRLQQLDQDGTTQLSNVVKVMMQQQNNFVVYPNPARDWVTVSYTATPSARATIRIYDPRGQVIQTEQWVMGAESNRQLLLNPREVGSGVYIVELDLGNRREFSRLVVN